MKLGSVGTGSIVEKVMSAALEAGGFEHTAVYSRKAETGQELVRKLGSGARIFTDYEKFLACPEVEAVYIASPNTLHYEQAKAALLAGKHVLCEKPLTPSLAQAEELVALANSKGLLFYEAITVLHLPNFALLKKQLKKIGPIHAVLANYTQYSSRYDALKAGQVTNIFNPAFAGGALMDLNVYNLYLMAGLFGKPSGIRYFANLWENGIDTSGTCILEYPGFHCVCTAAKDSRGQSSVLIEGENGFLSIPGSSNGCDSLILSTPAGTETLSLQSGHNRWYYEMVSLSHLMGSKDMDDCRGRQQIMLDVVEMLEQARRSAGLSF